ncbi:hypothetical protein AB1L16_14050 [Peribacillus frigoritolerans]|uniref:hypothetical protein n=1 Tax=Peribacillus frigoritolerans TaxID=450367 RepID=UPI002282B7F0|nr:hypothetical protein [Peribacillus frigoritolerans]MCY8936501.1 hypothetical protein [Peribacillus frigoritolerans]
MRFAILALEELQQKGSGHSQRRNEKNKALDVIDRKRVDSEIKPLWQSMSLKIDSFHYYKMRGANE